MASVSPRSLAAVMPDHYAYVALAGQSVDQIAQIGIDGLSYQPIRSRGFVESLGNPANVVCVK
jgi:hypothetical protein